MRRSLITISLFGLVVVGFGTAFALNSIAVSSLPPVWVAALRATVACFIFVTLVYATGRSIRYKPADVATYIVIGTTTGIIPFFLLAWGQVRVPSSVAAVLFASVPFTTVFISWGFFTAAAPTLMRVFGAILGLVGVAIAFPFIATQSDSFVPGAIAILVAAISYAFGGLFLQRAKDYDPISLMAGQFFVGAIVLIAATILMSGTLPSVTTYSYLSAVLVGVTGSAIPLVSLLLLLRRTDAVAASSVTFFVPFVAIAVGFFALGEAAPVRMFIGLALCLTGSMLVSRP